MLPPEKQELFKKLWAEKVKEEEIAKRLGIRVSMVTVYAKVMGLKPRRTISPSNRKLSNEDIMLMREMWFNGAKIQEIANYFNVHPTTVLQYLHAMGLKRRSKTKCPKIPKDELLKLCLQGLTDDEIARMYNTKKHCITWLRRKYGINKKLLLRKKVTEKLNKIVEMVIDILNERGYITSWDLRSLGLHADRKTLERLENIIEGLKWFKLVYVSTRKYAVFPTKFSQLYIAYLEGYERSVISFLLNNLVDKKVPRSVLRWILKINNVPQKLYELI